MGEKKRRKVWRENTAGLALRRKISCLSGSEFGVISCRWCNALLLEVVDWMSVLPGLGRFNQGFRMDLILYILQG